MAVLEWDKVGERFYETGVDRGVLYLRDETGAYTDGVAWNGLTAVTQAPSGAEANPQYADNIKYLNLYSAEEFSATIEAFTYPAEFARCDGSAEVVPGVYVGQQRRESFGFSYRTLKGNDLKGNDLGYKIHLVYGAMAAPSEKAHATVNDSPEPVNFSWEVTTTPESIGTVGGKYFKPTAIITADSTVLGEDKMTALEKLLYGDEAAEPKLPSPAEVIALMQAAG